MASLNSLERFSSSRPLELVRIPLLPIAFQQLDCGMPTVLRIGQYRFHFYSDESQEPAHIHVRSPDGECKFWLETVILARNRGIATHELRDIERLVFENRDFLRRKFDEHHNR